MRTRLTTKPGALRSEERRVGKETECSREDVVAGACAAHDLDEWHLGHGVEEVQADEPRRVREPLSEQFESDARRIRREKRARLHARLERCVERALGVCVFVDRLDDHVSLRHAVARDIGLETRERGRDAGLVLEPLREMLAGAGKRWLDEPELPILQRDIEAAQRAPGRDVAAHHARADDMDTLQVVRRPAAERLQAVLQEKCAHEVA